MEQAFQSEPGQHELNLHAILDGAPQAIFAINADGKTVLVNQSAYRIFGYGADELIGLPIEILLPEDSQDRHGGLPTEYFPHPAGRATGFGLHPQGRRKDGTLFRIDLAVNHIETPAGRLAVAYVDDITERLRTEEALLKREVQYRDLFEHMNEGFAYCRMIFENGVGTDFVFLAVNERFETLTGRKNAVGKRATDFTPDLQERDPEFLEFFANVARTGIAAKRELFVHVSQEWYLISAYSPQPGFFVSVFDKITERKRAEGALRESESEYRGLFENMNNAITYCEMIFENGVGTDFIFHAVNPAFEKLTGRKDVVGKRIRELNPQILELDPAWVEMHARVSLTGVSEKCEMFLHSTGQWYTMSVYSPKKGFFVEVFDIITERRRAEGALHQSEERFRLAAESTGMGTFDRDLRTGIRTWSTLAKMHFGLPPDMDVDDETFRSAIHPDDRERVPRVLEEAMQPGSSGECRDEYRTTGIQDGVERWVNVRGRVLFDRAGRPERFIGVTLDITERKRMEEALRRREREISTLLDHTPDLIVRLDREFRYTYVNMRAANMVGIPREAFIGKEAGELGVPQAVIQVWRPMSVRTFETGQPGILEYSYPSPAGTTNWEQRFIPEFEADGSVTSLLLIGRDITEQKGLERIAEAGRAEIRALAASLITAQEEERRRVARELHDQICQDLASLAIDVNRLARNPPTREDAPDRLEALQARIAKTADEARNISHRLHPSVLDDLGVVASLRGLCKDFSGRTGIAIEFTDCALPDTVPPEVAACLYRVAQQSLQNSAKHANATHISVELSRRREGSTSLTITDDGDGFDQAAVIGLGGLGLIGMKERARLLNGNVTISTAPGRGTRVTLELPWPTDTV